MKLIYLIPAIIVAECCAQAQDIDSIKAITSVVDAYPSLSPDGSLILFQSNRTGVFEIYTTEN